MRVRMLGGSESLRESMRAVGGEESSTGRSAADITWAGRRNQRAREVRNPSARTKVREAPGGEEAVVRDETPEEAERRESPVSN